MCLPHKQCTDSIPFFQSVLSQYPLLYLGIDVPVTAFTGVAITSPIETFLYSVTSERITVPATAAERAINITTIQRALETFTH